MQSKLQHRRIRAQQNIECFIVLRMGALDGKIAIVTGTSRGVGIGIAHELLRAGATVIGCSRSKLDALPGTEAEPDWARRSAQMTCDQGDYRCAVWSWRRWWFRSARTRVERGAPWWT